MEQHRHRPLGGRRTRLRWAWLCALALLTACAEASVNDHDADVSDIVEEPARDLADTRDTGPEPDIDAGPDASDADEPDLVGECEPFSVRCTESGYALQRCSAEGALFPPHDCAFDEVCEEVDGTARCVDCTDGVNCREDAPACEPGTSFCLDFQTAAECTADGQVGDTFGCTGRCFSGGCSTGLQTGQHCENHDDCGGRFCLCGDEDDGNTGSTLCAGDLAPGYCTTSPCDLNGCHPDTEVCADFALSGAFGGGHYCLLRETCGTRLSACRAGHRGDGHRCRELPSMDGGGVRTWALACWAPAPADPDTPCTSDNCIAPIGSACDGGSDCVGGLCVRQSGISYCAAPCDERQGCPSYAACVRPDANSDDHFCLARTSDCPRMDTNFSIVSRSFSQLGGVQTAQVCWF